MQILERRVIRAAVAAALAGMQETAAATARFFFPWRSRARNSRSVTRIPRARPILTKLDEPISMSLPEETPLEDVLKYIKQASTTKTYAGMQIYVDPRGLGRSREDP